MTDFRQQYKEKAFGFGSTNEGRLLRVEKREESRKKQRAKTFNENRNISNSAANSPQIKGACLPPVVEDRVTRLQKWRLERERRKKLDKTKKKPPFKVGVVHHKLYSPANKDGVVAPGPSREKINNQTAQTTIPVAPKRITRATEKRLMAKAATKKAATRALTKEVKKEQKNQKEQSFAPVDYKFKAPVGLSQMPLFGRIAVQSMTPNKINDFVLSPFKVKNQRHGTTEFIVEHIDVKENMPETSVKNSESVDSNTEESSMETLRLSSDEQETSVLSNESKREEKNESILNDKKQEKNNSKLNDSTTKTPSPLTNNLSTSLHSDSPSEPAFFSPYVVSSRGKSNARKEQQIRRGLSLGRSSSDNIPTKDTVMKNLNISVEEEERTAQYFLFILNKEIDRLTEQCDKWTVIKSEPDTTEDAQYQINQATGQTTLLINKKFERFRRLVSDCETGKGEMLVTCKDLQGFWDMMYMEIKDCDSRFDKLEKLRSQNWVEEQPVIKPITKKKVAVKKKVAPAKTSSIRAFLAERKKKMAQKEEGTEEVEEPGMTDKNILNDKLGKNENSLSMKQNRRSNSVNPNEQKSTPAKREGARMSLLQKVQLSETSKRMRSPLTIIKISKMCKTPEIQLDESISYVNSDQTPGKSILKRSKDSTDLESRMRSAHKVNFDDHVILNDIPVDEETRTKMNLAAALARIDSFDFDSPTEEEAINAGRKLDFDDNSFDESLSTHNDKQQYSEIEIPKTQKPNGGPVIQVQYATPLQESLSDNNLNRHRSKKSSRRQSTVYKDSQETDEFSFVNVKAAIPMEGISEDTELHVSKPTLRKQVSMHEEQEPNENDSSIRILRNRTVTSVDSPKTKRRTSKKVSINVQESEHKENKTPSRTRRKSALKVSINIDEKNYSKTDLEDGIDKISLDEDSDKRRRSTRRSVKFTAKDCTGCVDGKTALPMTPHVRHSKGRLSENRKSTFSGDLISWETPEKLPERVRRSQHKKV